MMCNLAKLEVVLMADLEKAKELLGSVDGYIPTQIRQDLASSLKHLGTDFTAISQMCTIKSQALTQAIESGKVSVYGPRIPVIHCVGSLTVHSLSFIINIPVHDWMNRHDVLLLHFAVTFGWDIPETSQ